MNYNKEKPDFIIPGSFNDSSCGIRSDVNGNCG